MQNILTIIQIATAISLIVLITLQSRGAGLGGIFGGTSNVYSTKRGVERVLFISTVVVAILFLGSALAGIILF